jgi:hypothetical protein
LPLLIIFGMDCLRAVSFLLEGKGIAIFICSVLGRCSSGRFQTSHVPYETTFMGEEVSHRFQCQSSFWVVRRLDPY